MMCLNALCLYDTKSGCQMGSVFHLLAVDRFQTCFLFVVCGIISSSFQCLDLKFFNYLQIFYMCCIAFLCCIYQDISLLYLFQNQWFPLMCLVLFHNGTLIETTVLSFNCYMELSNWLCLTCFCSLCIFLFSIEIISNVKKLWQESFIMMLSSLYQEIQNITFF